MKIVALGNGLLGSHIKKLYPDIPVVPHSECDITQPFDIDAVIRHYKPDVLVNCAGITPQSYNDLMKLFKVNSQGPKLLQAACDETGCKLIQVSTDCVFSGVKGNYCEIDIPNSNTFYGMSKYLGEITEFPHLTLRASFVGFPDPYSRGLLGWAAQQKEIIGYDQYVWNGVTATELARVIVEKLALGHYSNILHVYGKETLSKYDMLVQAKEVFGWEYTIKPESQSECCLEKHILNLTLTSEIPDMCVQKSFKQMLEEEKKLWNG